MLYFYTDQEVDSGVVFNTLNFFCKKIIQSNIHVGERL